MKLTLNFDEPLELTIKSSDDESNSYLLSWMGTEKKCSLWYNRHELVWEKEYDNLSKVIGEVVSAILEGMKGKEK
jgi:hypothetical protein